MLTTGITYNLQKQTNVQTIENSLCIHVY